MSAQPQELHCDVFLRQPEPATSAAFAKLDQCLTKTRLSNYNMDTACLTLAKCAYRSKDAAHVIKLLWTHASLAGYENGDCNQTRVGGQGTVSTINAYRTTRYHFWCPVKIRLPRLHVQFSWWSWHTKNTSLCTSIPKALETNYWRLGPRPLQAVLSSI